MNNTSNTNRQKNPQSITAFAPATVANVACAFDILGFAIEETGDKVTASFIEDSIFNKNESISTSEQQVIIQQISGDKIPTDPTKNTAGSAVLELLFHLKEGRRILLEIEKGLPIGSGLGSSSASSSAALVAVNALLGSPLSKQQLLPFAINSESIACGSAHPDNVVPCIMGGCTLIRSVNPLDVIQLPVPEDLICIVVSPKIELRTEDARKILNRELPLNKIVTQLGNVAGLIAGFYRNDLELISRSLNDVLIEPQRAVLIPGFNQVKQNAIEAGALGCSISGSGPTIFAFSKRSADSLKIKERMIIGFKDVGIEASSIISKINIEGAKVT